MDWREQDGVRWLEATLPGARAAFSTRLGGESAGAFESLNLGLFTDDAPDAVLANRDRLGTALDREPENVLFGHQVHGAELLVRDRAPAPNAYTDRASRPPRADGQLTIERQPDAPGPGRRLPAAGARRRRRRGDVALRLARAGRRNRRPGATAVGARAAAVGPGIGRCCYEVGAEVVGAFEPLGDGIADGRMLDLAEVARRLLARAGVEQVEVAGLCTSCEPALFFSHRRDHGRTGRQAGLAWLEDDA